METIKNLGIWMDHSSAHIIDATTGITSPTVTSKYTHEVMEQSMSKGEHLAHNKEQHEQSDYYKKLGEVIKGYKNVVLFGPTDAKKELYNVLKGSRHFDSVNIETANADKMTENQQAAFVREYFTNKH